MTAQSFNELVIAASGTFPGYKQADLKTLAEGHGATFSTTVNDLCTHLISTEKDVEKKGTKYQAASKLANCHIVSLEWFLESSVATKPVPEKPYFLGSGQNGVVQDIQKNGTQTEATGTKRAVKQNDESNGDPHKMRKDSQRISFKTLNVPVDEEYFIESGYFADPKVYIEDTGLIWDATLNQTVAAQNNNKFYRIQLLLDEGSKRYATWTHWGRVGERGQSTSLGDGSLASAMKSFEKKFKDKTGLKWEDRLDPPKKGKYTFIERNYEEDAGEEQIRKEESSEDKSAVESALSKPLQNLLSFIFNTNHFLSAMASMNYDAQKLPLGKLSDRTLKTGFSILKELSELISAPDLAASRYDIGYAPALGHLSDRYFTTIPHVFGRNRPPVLDSDAYIKKEIELLEALTDMDVAHEIMKESKDAEVNELDRQFQSLGMKEMTRLEHDSSEYKELEKYLQNSRGSTHHLRYTIIDIFRIERQGEEERFTSSNFANIPTSNRRLLWHGSRSTNYGGILSQGLRIAPPEAPVNGYMFGKGVYLADTSSKSANYCCPYNSANKGLLLLCDAELGAPMYELYGSDYEAGTNAQRAGKIATLGLGRNTPGGWKDAGCLGPALRGVSMPDTAAEVACDDKACLQYNEYIAYDVAQIRQRYLFYVHMR